MRYIKVLILAVAFVVSMIFFVQNTPIFSQTLQLQLEVLDFRWTSVAMPIYLVILLSFFLGAILSTLYFFVEKLRLSAQLSTATAKVRKLEDEVAKLRSESAASAAPSYSALSSSSTATETAKEGE